MSKKEVKNELFARATALGNSDYGLKHVCSDLLNKHGRDKKAMAELLDGTFLGRNTLLRMMSLDDAESGAQYSPNADTCERILRFFNCALSFNSVKITPAFQNKEKGWI